MGAERAFGENRRDNAVATGVRRPSIGGPGGRGDQKKSDADQLGVTEVAHVSTGSPPRPACGLQNAAPTRMYWRSPPNDGRA